ncbi:MAG: glycosyltransferase family 4 protein [Fibromonadaceae bacterium]|jgi:glycosyltransferase involved in cell wall biosynthesis|nr:glycosyltransferase family 4 protein [Fibromonadaceae bacterium]
MKINFLLPCFGTRPLGGFRIVYQYANKFADKGHEVSIIYASGRESKFLFLARRVITFFVKDAFSLHKSIRKSYVFKLNNNTIPDADITFATACTTAVALNSCSESKGERIYLIQGYETWSMPQDKLNETWRYKDMKKIVISKYLKDIGEQLGVFDTIYIPNSINCDLFRLAKGTNNRKYNIAMMYSEWEVKGSKYGLQAIEIMKKKYPDLRVMFFGIKSRDKKIPKWIDYVKKPSQDFLTNDIYNNSSIYLCSSISEGWGLPPMEAMACGAAVVTTQNGGISDFCIDGENALICEIKNPEQMARNMERIYLNADLHTSLVRNGLEKIKEFSLDRSFELLESLCQKILNSKTNETNI